MNCGNEIFGYKNCGLCSSICSYNQWYFNMIYCNFLCEIIMCKNYGIKEYKLVLRRISKRKFEYLPVVFSQRKLWVSSSLTDSSPSPSFLVSRLPLTCWHLPGASLSHSPDSSYRSLCDGTERMVFFLLRLSSWQKPNLGASAKMLQGFCSARDDPSPPSLPPSPPHLPFFGVMS